MQYLLGEVDPAQSHIRMDSNLWTRAFSTSNNRVPAEGSRSERRTKHREEVSEAQSIERKCNQPQHRKKQPPRTRKVSACKVPYARCVSSARFRVTCSRIS
jgi:hypothetical protein